MMKLKIPHKKKAMNEKYYHETSKCSLLIKIRNGKIQKNNCY